MMHAFLSLRARFKQLSQLGILLLLVSLPVPCWGQEDCFNPDLSNDGHVGAADLILLLTYFDMAWPLDTGITCPSSIEHQGHAYGVVQMGNQCWFSENCRHLPSVAPPSAQEYTVPHAFVLDYNGTDVAQAMATDAYATYGALYNFVAVTEWDLCPSGWHTATDQDWFEMEAYMGIQEAELNTLGWRGEAQGDQLKDSLNWNGTDNYGMGFLPGGQTFSNDAFGNEGTAVHIWVATEYTFTKGWYRALSTGSDGLFRSNNVSKTLGGYTRCVAD